MGDGGRAGGAPVSVNLGRERGSASPGCRLFDQQAGQASAGDLDPDSLLSGGELFGYRLENLPEPRVEQRLEVAPRRQGERLEVQAHRQGAENLGQLTEKGAVTPVRLIFDPGDHLDERGPIQKGVPLDESLELLGQPAADTAYFLERQSPGETLRNPGNQHLRPSAGAEVPRKVPFPR